jgi:hypothetical protein
VGEALKVISEDFDMACSSQAEAHSRAYNGVMAPNLAPPGEERGKSKFKAQLMEF